PGRRRQGSRAGPDRRRRRPSLRRCRRDRGGARMMTPLWTAAEIAAATGGTVHGDFAATGVSIDTRSLDAGDLFVALGGVRDGHEFVAGALAKGAAGSLVSRAVEGPHVLVDDVLA